VAKRVAVVGTDHGHIVEITHELARAGAEIAAVVATEPAIGPWLAKQYPDAKPLASLDEALTFGVDLVATAAIPSERTQIALTAMRAGVDVVADKPGATSYEQLAALEAEHATTGRHYTVVFSERLGNPAMVAAQQLVAGGRIGAVVQTVGLGPHTLSLEHRPSWFFDPDRYGGILVDIGSHQVDQFLAFTGSTDAEVIASTVRSHPEHPGVEIVGEMMLASDRATGYARLDYLTPAGLGAWGDVRFTAVGTEGYLEARYVDKSVLVVDGERRETIDCSEVPVRWAADLLAGSPLPQAHVFTVTRLCLDAQRRARRL
jgi:predicted dehydrogenase